MSHVKIVLKSTHKPSPIFYHLVGILVTLNTIGVLGATYLTILALHLPWFYESNPLTSLLVDLLGPIMGPTVSAIGSWILMVWATYYKPKYTTEKIVVQAYLAILAMLSRWDFYHDLTVLLTVLA